MYSSLFEDLDLALLRAGYPSVQKAFLAYWRGKIQSSLQDTLPQPRLTNHCSAVGSLTCCHHSHVFQRAHHILRLHPAHLCNLPYIQRSFGLHVQNRSCKSSLPESHVSSPPQLTQWFLWPTHPALSSAKLVAHTHENFAKAFALPRREDEDTGKVIVVPAHFFLAEEADDLGMMMRAGAVGGVDEEVVVEGGDIEEDRLVVEEKFCKEGQILGEKLGNEGRRANFGESENQEGTNLVFLAIHLVDGVQVSRVD